MSLEIYLGVLLLAVIVFAMWALITVFHITFVEDWDDVVDEVEQEQQFLEAVQRAARR